MFRCGLGEHSKAYLRSPTEDRSSANRTEGEGEGEGGTATEAEAVGTG